MLHYQKIYERSVESTTQLSFSPKVGCGGATCRALAFCLSRLSSNIQIQYLFNLFLKVIRLFFKDLMQVLFFYDWYIFVTRPKISIVFLLIYKKLYMDFGTSAVPV